ncbi:MAG: WGR domain-containing protein [Archangium sp.]|nr:WGR domain-containing protein [Archangium sp.]
MARRFEFVEGSSSKFWEVSVEGNTLTVVFGKIGTAGQTKPKDFASPEAAQKEADKLVSEKTKKGYVEVGSAPAAAAGPKPAQKKPAKGAELAAFQKAEDGFFGEPDWGEVTFGEVSGADHYVDSATGDAWAELFKEITWLAGEADGALIGSYHDAIVFLDNEGQISVTGKTLVDHFAWKKFDEELDALVEFASEHGLPPPMSKKDRETSIKGVPSPSKKLDALLKKAESKSAGPGARPVDRHPAFVALGNARGVFVSSEDDQNKRQNYDAHAAFLFDGSTFSLLPETPFKSYLALYGAGVLPDGRAVFIGASDTMRAMIFDPAAQKWEAGPELKAKQEHPAVQLLPDGRVLVAGGERGYPHKTDAIQLYDVKKKKWSAGGKLKVAREHAAPVLLPDGRVLLLAGSVPPDDDYNSHSDMCEVFDPKKGTVKPIAKPKGEYGMPHALLLTDGRVVMCDQSGHCAIYDPKKDAWTKPVKDERITPPMVQLSTGEVAFFNWKQTVTLLDPKTMKLSKGGETLVPHNIYSAAMALPDGKVLLVGGDLYNNIASEPELYDSASKTSAPIAGFEKQMKKQQAALAKKKAKEK